MQQNTKQQNIMQQNIKHVSFSLWRGTEKDYGRAGTGVALLTSGT
jgi:hypothetical protein